MALSLETGEMSELEPWSVTLPSGALGLGQHLMFSFSDGHGVKSLGCSGGVPSKK